MQLPPKYQGHSISNSTHGNGKLWTTLPLDGKLLVKPDKDGSLSEKFNWWRTIPGNLTISGRRLDGPGAMRASIPAGYADIGYQASGIYFSSAGCWEVTGRVDDTKLTFVLEVRIKQ
jgi:hypothetical protein